jgi:hypothetical protein
MTLMRSARNGLLLGSVLWWIGCEPAGASWRLTEPLEGAVAPVEAQGEEPADVVADDRFPSDEEIAHMEDPLGENQEGAGEVPEEATEEGAVDDGADGIADDLAPPEEVPAPVVETVVQAESLAKEESPAGLPKAPGWGVRLVATLPAAQPPRAVLGLPTGAEVVVSPGSMVPEVGVVVIAVGRGTVDLAVVTPEGDHARVEQRTLHAQYQGAESTE